MVYVIAEPCVGTKDTACVDACPVDCIHPKKDEPAYATEVRIGTAVSLELSAVFLWFLWRPSVPLPAFLLECPVTRPLQ